jgi:hypothetical protein
MQKSVITFVSLKTTLSNMKHFKAIGLYSAIVLCIFLCSCNSADKNALPIPKDAAFVMHINTKSLTSKLSWEDIKKSNWYNMADRPEAGVVKDLLQNPDTAGIDTKEDLAFFMKKLSKNQAFMAFTGRLKNAAAFEAFNKKAAGGDATVAKDGDISSIKLQERALVSWSGDKFIYVMDAATPSMGDFNMPQTDSLSLDDTANNYRMLPPPAGDLKGYARNLFNLKGDSLLVTDDRYTSLLKTDGDVHVWTNAESAMGQDMPGGGMLGMLKLDKYFKGAVGATTLSFDNGKISIRSKGYYNKDMASVLKKYEGDNLNSSFVERLPSDNVVAVMAMNYKPEGLKEFLKLGGLDGLVNGFFGEAGLSLDDFIKANKGDLVLALTDFQMKEYTVNLGGGSEPFKGTKPDVNILFVTSIGDKASFDKLVEAGKKIGGEMKADSMVSYAMNKDVFVIGNNKQAVDQYVAGGKKNFPFLSKINSHPIGVYVDLQKVIAAYNTQPSADSSKAAITAASLAMWQDVVATGGEFKDGGMVQDLEINLVDKNTNSLKQLSAYADKLAVLNKRGF